MARRATNGKGVLFTVRFLGKSGAKDRISYAIAVADIPSGKHRVILKDAVYARYASSGHLLYVTANKTLMVAPFDQNSMTVTGEPTALTQGMRLGLGGSADLAFRGPDRWYTPLAWDGVIRSWCGSRVAAQHSRSILIGQAVFWASRPSHQTGGRSP